MLLASVDKMLSFVGSTQDPNIRASALTYLESATTAIARRIGSELDLATRYSLFSVTEADLRNVGELIELRLGNSLLTTNVVEIRIADAGDMITNSTEGVLYEGKRIVDTKRGTVTIPKKAVRAGSYNLSVKYTSGYEVLTDEDSLLKDAPEPLVQAAIAYATKIYYSSNTVKVGGKFNKVDHRVLEQTINDMYSVYDRPRALVIFEELDEKVLP